MMVAMKYVTLSTAIETTRRLLGGKEEVTLAEVYQVSNRENKDEEVNRLWVTNKLTHLKHYGLVEPIYTEGRPNRLIGVRITSEGKKAIQLPSPSSHTAGSVAVKNNEIGPLIRQMRENTKILKQILPSELEVVFDVRLRKGELSSEE
jgi:hypothetical protein